MDINIAQVSMSVCGDCLCVSGCGCGCVCVCVCLCMTHAGVMWCGMVCFYVVYMITTGVSA